MNLNGSLCSTGDMFEQRSYDFWNNGSGCRSRIYHDGPNNGFQRYTIHYTMGIVRKRDFRVVNKERFVQNTMQTTLASRHGVIITYHRYTAYAVT